MIYAHENIIYDKALQLIDTYKGLDEAYFRNYDNYEASVPDTSISFCELKAEKIRYARIRMID